MKLTRITKIRGHRVFRDFAWPTELHAFAQFNLIYGWNGCGKTTLSSLLSHLQRREALAEGQVEFEFDSSAKVTGTALSTAALPDVRVFNRDFINTTIQAVGSGLAPIYFLGEASIEKQVEVEKLKTALAAANAELATATSEKQAATVHLDAFCVARAKLVKEVLTSANSARYNNYDKRSFDKASKGLAPELAAAPLASDAEKARLRSQKDAQPKLAIDKVESPTVDFLKLAAEVSELVSRSVVATTLDALTADGAVGSWVQEGLLLHSAGRHADTCRFCEGPLNASRRAALEAHFNDAFASFQAELAGLLVRLSEAKQQLALAQLPDPTRFYDHLTGESGAALLKAKAAIAAGAEAISSFIARVEAKRAKPFDPSELVEGLPPTSIPSLAEAFVELNVVVQNHNKTTADFNRSVEDACKQLEVAYLLEAREEYLRLVAADEAANELLRSAAAKPRELQSQIDEIEKKIVEHRRPADELSEDLRAYLGRDELRFEVSGTGYSLTRGGLPVAHLSEGERTAIAFLYFLKSLQDKAFDIAKGIVVIDDPVSSLDANALFSAFGYMKERTKHCGQLFVLTHSFAFFRQVKNWFHNLPKQQKKNLDVRPARFFLLRSRSQPDGVRTSFLGPLDPLLEEHESEYQYLFKRVYKEAHRSDVKPLEHHYELPNVARRLVEAFLAFRFPDTRGDLWQRLERVKFEDAKKTRILRLLNTYSHAGAITDPEHDLSLLAETQPVLLDVLEMMRTTDGEHYAGLERLMSEGASS
ncbi:MAG: AAA family ATPase [Myxococcales bacterium]|nr:AAA family ATPase [Myxococcales bacterium]